MLLGIVKKSENSFAGKTLDGKYVEVDNFRLGNDAEEGMCMEIDLTGLDFHEVSPIK